MKKIIYLAIALGVSIAIAKPLEVKPKETKPHEDFKYVDLPFETVSFSKDIKPIIQNRCTECHTGNNKLLNLLSYDVAKANGQRIRSAIIGERMPLRNLTGITGIERYKIRAWVDKGMKE